MGIVLKEVSPNKLALKPITQEAQVDVMNLSISDKQRVAVGLDKENHSIFVPKPYVTTKPSTPLKPKGEKPECASALHWTGKNSGCPPDKRNVIVLRSRQIVNKTKAKSPLSRNKKGIPCEILNELELQRLLEVEDGDNEEGGMEEAEGNAQLF